MDYYYFIDLILILFLLQGVIIYRCYKRLPAVNGYQIEDGRFIGYLSLVMLGAVVVSLWSGWFFVQRQEVMERRELRAVLDNIAPILAYDLKKMGHARITLDTPDNDPHYLSLIQTMTDWMKLNPQIESLYTFRKTSDGSVVFILGPETDYNLDGVIKGEKEERVPIGTVYNEAIPEIESAFAAKYSFQEEPTEDAWSFSISAFMPIYNDDSNIPEAILGIDFNGANWQATILKTRLLAIGIISSFIIFLNACFLILCYSWFERVRIKQQKYLQEMARLDQLNLVGQIAVSIGHEIRNPMTTVRGYLQLMKKGETDWKRSERYDLMIEELDRANAIITEFLSLSKNKAVNLQQSNLNHVLHRLLPLLQADAVQAGHEIKLDTAEVGEIAFDEKEIRQLILNLVKNALESMTSNGTVYIRTYAEGDTVVLAVRDQGSGIPPEVIEKLGTPFTTTKPNGTGLGLAVCFRIIERHGATMNVDTGPKGTTVIVKFGKTRT